MKISQFIRTKKKIISILLTILLAVLLMWFVQDLARTIVLVPILYLIWVTDLASHTIPQYIIWGLFLLIGSLILGKSLFRPGRIRSKPRETVIEYTGRVEELARIIQFSQKWEYSRWNLAHHLAELASEIFASHGHRSYEHIKKQLEHAKMNLSPEIQSYFQAGLSRKTTQRNRFFSRLRARIRSEKQSSSLDLDPERAVRFLEEHMEISHEDGTC